MSDDVRVYDVAFDPEAQPMLLRLGLQIGDISSGLSRIEIVKNIAATVVARRRAQ